MTLLFSRMMMENIICILAASGEGNCNRTGTMYINADYKEPLPDEKALGPRVAMLTEDMKQFDEAVKEINHP